MTEYQVYEGKMDQQDQQMEWYVASYPDRLTAQNHCDRILERYEGETIDEQVYSDGTKTWSVVVLDQIVVCTLHIKEVID
jgi:negative regulator of sigma E activity